MGAKKHADASWPGTPMPSTGSRSATSRLRGAQARRCRPHCETEGTDPDRSASRCSPSPPTSPTTPRCRIGWPTWPSYAALGVDEILIAPSTPDPVREIETWARGCCHGRRALTRSVDTDGPRLRAAATRRSRDRGVEPRDAARLLVDRGDARRASPRRRPAGARRPRRRRRRQRHPGAARPGPVPRDRPAERARSCCSSRPATAGGRRCAGRPRSSPTGAVVEVGDGPLLRGRRRPR